MGKTYISECEVERRKTEMLKKIAKTLEKGVLIPKAVEMYKNEYAEYTGTILTKGSVSIAFNCYMDKEKRDRIVEERLTTANRLYSEGVFEKEIAERLGVSTTYIRKLTGKQTKRIKKPDPESEGLWAETINEFKESIKDGDVLDCIMVRSVYSEAGMFIDQKTSESVKVIKKYPFVAETDKGFIRWADLYAYWKARNDKK